MTVHIDGLDGFSVTFLGAVAAAVSATVSAVTAVMIVAPHVLNVYNQLYSS